LEDQEENQMTAKQFEDVIDGHAKEAAMHYMAVMEIKEGGL
jgi:hypothetical protein